MKKLLFASAILCSLMFYGCLDAEKTMITLEIHPDLQGKLTLEFLGITSTEKTPEARKTEMSKFVSGEYRSEAAKIVEEWSLTDYTPTISNKTDLKCDGKIVGDFKNLVRTLTPLTDENGAVYQIQRDKDRFSFTVSGISYTKDDMTLTITYAGKILENNAQHYDAATGRMEWNLGKLDAAGIHFVLETAPSH